PGRRDELRSCSLALRRTARVPRRRRRFPVPAPRRRRRLPSKIGRALPLPPPSCQILPRLRSSEAVRYRKRRGKDALTRTCPTLRWKSTSAWPDRVRLTSLTASDKVSLWWSNPWACAEGNVVGLAHERTAAIHQTDIETKV